MTDTTSTEKLANDLLFGAGAIADELGVPIRKAFYLLEEGLIPGSKVGRTWAGSRRDLREHFAKLPRPTPRTRKTKPAAAKGTRG